MSLLFHAATFLWSALHTVLSIIVTLLWMALVAIIVIYGRIAPELPDPRSLREARLQIPLRIYSADGRLMAEIGAKRRIPLRIDQIPAPLIHTIIAVEDERFFDHPGVDWQGLARAAWALLRTGEKVQGGSTITMQVARNFYLSPEKSYQRKLKEILLALSIERVLTKSEILELYLNKIYFGNRAYGIGAAAWVYYGLTVDALTVPQIATLAGLPKAPSRDNPIANPARALMRRNYVLQRLVTLGIIDDSTYQTALATPENARLHGPEVEVNAPYFVEMTRVHLNQVYGEEAYTAGLRVYTTLDPERQRLADVALRKGLRDFEERHGYRGPEGGCARPPLEINLDKYQKLSELPIGCVIKVEGRSAQIKVSPNGVITLNWDGLAWARRRLADGTTGAAPRQASEILRVGEAVRVHLRADGKWVLAQRPGVSGALVSLNPRDGAIIALSGGYDFAQSSFNRAIQAERQPGSSFKPFIYLAALERGYNLASIFHDAPMVVDLPGRRDWRPENYGGKYRGPTRLREALIHSLNLVSIRLLQALGVDYVIDYVTKFGFTRERTPRNLTLALGTLLATPLDMARAYAILANGGYQVTPYFIERIEDVNGSIIFQSEPPSVCRSCLESETKTVEGLPIAPRVVDARDVYLINSLLRDVIQRGTAVRAKTLGRNDLAGKTGTTNEERDAWFSGFNSEIVTTVWIGYDNNQPLGTQEAGGKTALPIWMDYMAEALRGIPEDTFNEPPGLVTMRINSRTGYLSSAGEVNAIFETFRADNLPSRAPAPIAIPPPRISSHDTDGFTPRPKIATPTIPEQLF